MRLLAGAAFIGLGLPNLLACSANGGASGMATPAQGVVVDAKASWPHYRGVAWDGFSPEKGINKDWQGKAPKLLWQTALTDGGYTGPSSAFGLVYVVDHQGSQDIVRALKLADGSEAWRYTYPDADQSNYGFARSTPTIDGENLYVVSRLGKVLCLGAKSGKPIWQDDMVKDFGGQRPNWDYAGSALVDGARLIVTPGAPDAAIVALDKATGKVLMKGGSGAAGYATPVVATLGGKKQYVVVQAKKVAGIDASDGKEIWSFPWETPYDVNAAQPIVIGDSVYVSSGYGHGCAAFDIQGDRAAQKWQNRAIQAHFSSAIQYQGRIFGTGDPGVLVCLDSATGNVLWKQPGFEKGGLMAVDGVMLVHNGSNGDLAMVKLDAGSYQELGRIAPLKGQAWTAPIMVGKILIVRNTSAIAAVDLG